MVTLVIMQVDGHGCELFVISSRLVFSSGSGKVRARDAA
jgi:hypothetical protein